MNTRLFPSAILWLGLAATARPEIINSSFESGNTSGWTVAGTAGLVEVLTGSDIENALVAPDGSFFALLSTGSYASDAPPSGATALRSTAYLVTDSAASLSFFYNFLTAEDNDGNGAPDFFEVVVSRGGMDTPLLSMSVQAGLPPAFIGEGGFLLTPGLSAFIYQTGFQPFSIPLGVAAGEQIVLEFRVSDASNPDLHTGLAIDGLSASGLTPTPEPPHGILLATGLVVMFAWRQARHRARGGNS